MQLRTTARFDPTDEFEQERTRKQALVSYIRSWASNKFAQTQNLKRRTQNNQDPFWSHVMQFSPSEGQQEAVLPEKWSFSSSEASSGSNRDSNLERDGTFKLNRLPNIHWNVSKLVTLKTSNLQLLAQKLAPVKLATGVRARLTQA